MFSVTRKVSRDTVCVWGRGGGPSQYHQMTHGEGGAKIGQKVSRII